MSDEAQERRLWFRNHILPLKGELLRYAVRIAPPEIDAEDLVQEAFVRVMSSDWRDVRTPGAVLKRTMRNHVYDLLRRRGLVPFRRLTDADAAEIRHPEPDPEATLSSRQQLQRLSAVVASLPNACRQVFILRKFKERSIKEIAEELDLSVSTVEKHLVRALRLCSERLALLESERGSEAAHDGPKQGRVVQDSRRGGGVGRPPVGDGRSKRG